LKISICCANKILGALNSLIINNVVFQTVEDEIECENSGDRETSLLKSKEYLEKSLAAEI